MEQDDKRISHGVHAIIALKDGRCIYPGILGSPAVIDERSIDSWGWGTFSSDILIVSSSFLLSFGRYVRHFHL